MKTFICLAISSLLVGLLYVYVRQQLAQVNASIASLTAMMRTVAEVTAQNGIAVGAQTNYLSASSLPPEESSDSEEEEDGLQEVSDDEEEDEVSDDEEEEEQEQVKEDCDVQDIRVINTSPMM